MPRVMLTFERSYHGTAPTTYRVIDRADAAATGALLTNAMIERFDGFDFMGEARWGDAGREGVEALLNELIYFTVTKTLPNAVSQDSTQF